MARVIAPFKLRGSCGNLIFYEVDGVNYCKEKGSPNEWQMKHGEPFAGARRQGKEFGRASAAGKLFRQAMGTAADGLRLHSLSSRMCTWLLGALQSDPVSNWGVRNLTATDLGLLDGFDFNQQLLLDDILPVNLDDSHRVQEDRVRVSMPGFRLRRKKKIPVRVTHYRIVSGLVYIDFGKRVFKRDLHYSDYHTIGNKHCAPFEVEHLLQEHAGMAAFWLWGIEYHESTTKGLKLVKGGSMRLMKAWNVQEVRQIELNRAELEAIGKQALCFECAVVPVWVGAREFVGQDGAARQSSTGVTEQEVALLSNQEADFEAAFLSPEVQALQAEMLAEYERRVATYVAPEPVELVVDIEGSFVPSPEAGPLPTEIIVAEYKTVQVGVLDKVDEAVGKCLLITEVFRV